MRETKSNEDAADWVRLLRLLFGAGGIYGSFIYYGALQESVFKFTDENGDKFKSVWFLQVLETFVNVVVAFVGRYVMGGTPNLPMSYFMYSGTSQVSAKAFSSFALASGVSYPLLTLAKSGKMVPVMIGSLLVGKASYTLQEYFSVLAIVVGTCLVSGGGKSSKNAENSVYGLLFIVLSLICDGITGGFQNRIKSDLTGSQKPKPYDFMMYTNIFMMIVALVVAAGTGDFQVGLKYCLDNPMIYNQLIRFAICSAIGQSFIFYTIDNFNPLVCCTITTTRKIISVFVSIVLHGHELSSIGWSGIILASVGILLELHKEMFKHHTPPSDKPLSNDDARVVHLAHGTEASKKILKEMCAEYKTESVSSECPDSGIATPVSSPAVSESNVKQNYSKSKPTRRNVSKSKEQF